MVAPPDADLFAAAPPEVSVYEVSPRDGLQNEPIIVPLEGKLQLIQALADAGIKRIEATSFVSPKWVPQLADAGELISELLGPPGSPPGPIVYTALVPNARGGERAIDGRTDEFNLVMSASATHNLANLRMTQAQSVRTLAEVIAQAQQARVAVNVSLSCAFGCPMEGEVPGAEVLAWVQRFVDLGVTNVTLCDTTGMADPGLVARRVGAAVARFPQVAFTAHFHDTRGLAGANTYAALQAGVTRFDASLGGIGGCPYAPGASGNVATEDLVHLLQCLGLDCGLTVEGLAPATKHLRTLLGHDLPAAVGRAGPRWQRHAPPADFEQIRERALARDATG